MFYGMEGVARHDDRRFAMGILASALGGGMSSRLFQEIREKRGLAYSVMHMHNSLQEADRSVFTPDVIHQRRLKLLKSFVRF